MRKSRAAVLDDDFTNILSPIQKNKFYQILIQLDLVSMLYKILCICFLFSADCKNIEAGKFDIRTEILILTLKVGLSNIQFTVSSVLV